MRRVTAQRVFRAMLVLIVTANLLGLGNVAFNRAGLLEMFPDMRPWMLVALVTLSLASVVSCCALWRWRRWGFFLVGSAYALMSAINLSFGAPAVHTVLAPLGFVLLLAAAVPVRHRFRRDLH